MDNQDFMDPMEPNEQNPVTENDSDTDAVLEEVEEFLQQDDHSQEEETEFSETDGWEMPALEDQETDLTGGDEFHEELRDLLGDPLGSLDAPTEILDHDHALAGAGEEKLLPEQDGTIPASEEFRDQEYRDTFGDDLDRAFGDLPEEEPEEPQRPVRRKLPKKPKKGSGLFGIPHFLATILYFVVILAISVTLARVVWLCADDMLALTKEKEETVISVTLTETDTLESVAERLVDHGFIRNGNVFTFKGAEKPIAMTLSESDTVEDFGRKLQQAGFKATGNTYSLLAEKLITVTITDSDTLEDIAKKLVDAGLVRYDNLFEFYGKFTDAREKISSGTFQLDKTYDYHALVSAMNRSSSNRTEITVTIPEGYSCRQIFALLEENGVCTAEKLGEAAMEGEYKGYWFLNGLPRDSEYCLEGYLFPDTYNFYLGDDPERVIDKMLDDFDYRFRESMQNQIATLNDRLAKMMRNHGYDEEYIDAHRMTIREIVTVASLIEKETAGRDESATIASVIYNRLTNAGNYPYLDIDATVLYALGEHKEVLTAEDLQIDSPYNTRNHQGLPPGPIANPGLDSLQAALNPKDTGYYFYALDKATGMHHFTETYEAHMQFLQSQE